MGGVKRKSMAAMEKQQGAQDEAQQPGQAAKGGKKTTEKKNAPQQQKKLPFLAPKMSELDMLKTLTPLKAITIFTASRALGVNASIANSLVRTLETKKLITRMGGYSGHYVWTVAK